MRNVCFLNMLKTQASFYSALYVLWENNTIPYYKVTHRVTILTT